MKFAILVFALFLQQAQAFDIRYCEGQPQRYADGTIKRSAKALMEFKLDHPCPVTGESTGACSGWAVDHIIPLAVGGCDTSYNMQWLPLSIKACAGSQCKDRWERKIYANPPLLLKQFPNIP
jgi:hypothetical protein